jgi:hypothetical protein
MEPLCHPRDYRERQATALIAQHFQSPFSTPASATTEKGYERPENGPAGVKS